LIRAPCLCLELSSKRKIRNHRRLHDSLSTRCCQERKCYGTMLCAPMAAGTPYGRHRFQATSPGHFIGPVEQRATADEIAKSTVAQRASPLTGVVGIQPGAMRIWISGVHHHSRPRHLSWRHDHHRHHRQKCFHLHLSARHRMTPLRLRPSRILRR
jgi:hypothetical protein